MITRVRLLCLMCAGVIVAGCGPDPGNSNQRNRWGATNEMETYLTETIETIEHPTYVGEYDPAPDQLQGACYSLMQNENIAGTPLEEKAKQMVALEQKIHDVYNSPEASKETLLAVCKEMEALLAEIREEL
ncbi:MAG: hypothetical protein MK161_16215 [Pirellulales bacterium]|nr:hypothetical protein [Pirellulales bacterium]